MFHVAQLSENTSRRGVVRDATTAIGTTRGGNIKPHGRSEMRDEYGIAKRFTESSSAVNTVQQCRRVGIGAYRSKIRYLVLGSFRVGRIEPAASGKYP